MTPYFAEITLFTELWGIAFSVAGIGGICAFVLYSLYRQWLKLPIFSTLKKQHQFYLLVLFLILTFLFTLTGLILWSIRPGSNGTTGTDGKKHEQLVELCETRSKTINTTITTRIEELRKLDLAEGIRTENRKRFQNDITLLSETLTEFNRLHSEFLEAVKHDDSVLMHERSRAVDRVLFDCQFVQTLGTRYYLTYAEKDQEVEGKVVKVKIGEIQLQPDQESIATVKSYFAPLPENVTRTLTPNARKVWETQPVK